MPVAGFWKQGRWTVLCEEGNEEEMVRKIFRETATNGVRARRCEKYFLKPGVEKVSTPWGEVRIFSEAGGGEGFYALGRGADQDRFRIRRHS